MMNLPALVTFYFPYLCILVRCTLGAPPADPLQVSTKLGIFQGTSTANSTEHWLGVPFAQSPVGALRFKAPQPITKKFTGIQNASTFGNACPQPPGDLGATISEDCLFLNIFRPNNTRANAKLPVLFWIYGGAYTNGAASNPAFNPTRILQRSVAIGKPIIFVSTNYRVNTFGFLSSEHVAPEDLNAGLLDQVAAMQFVQQNIAAFGGDPTKVTIWGQSAGAGSVEAHFVYPTSGQQLFRAGIADSSVGPFKTSPPASVYDQPGKPFARLLNATGCSPGPRSVACLQSVPFDKLLNISNTFIANTLNNQLWQPSIGPAGSFAPEQASHKIASGRFLNLPYLAGTNLNEGTTFSASISDLSLVGEAQDKAFDTYIRDLLIDDSKLTPDVLAAIRGFYPANDSALGAPFNTGDSLFDRGAAWYTDNMFLSARRNFFENAAARGQDVFGYHFREFIPGNDPRLGVFHASELPLLFGPVPTPVEEDFANQMLDFYLNFVTDLSPGQAWPKFTTKSPNVLQLMRNNITAIPDDFNKVRNDFLKSQRVLDQMQK